MTLLMGTGIWNVNMFSSVLASTPLRKTREIKVSSYFIGILNRMEKTIDLDVAHTFLDITQRVIIPERMKGATHMSQKASDFIARFDRNVRAPGTPTILYCGQSSLRCGDNGDVSMRPTVGLSSAPLLPLNPGTNSISRVSE